jgi:hypothetical protein
VESDRNLQGKKVVGGGGIFRVFIAGEYGEAAWQLFEIHSFNFADDFGSSDEGEEAFLLEATRTANPPVHGLIVMVLLQSSGVDVG